MASFAYGSVRPSYARPQASPSTSFAPESSTAQYPQQQQGQQQAQSSQASQSSSAAPSALASAGASQTLQSNIRRTTLRDPFAPNLDNPLMCSPEARAFAEKQRLKIQQLPDRFMNPESFRFNSVKQHPAYRTSSNTYGSREPVDIEMPLAYFSVDSSFTGSLGSSHYRNQSLAVGKPKRPIGY